MLQLSICHSAVCMVLLGLETKTTSLRFGKLHDLVYKFFKLTDGNGPTSWEKNGSFRSPRKQLETSAAHLKKHLVKPMKRLEIS